MKKNILIILLTLLVIFTQTNNIVYANNDLYLSSGKVLETLGVLKGTETGDLKLKDNLTRQDLVVLMSRLYKEENKAKSFLVKPKFKDIPENDTFYSPYIGWAVDKNLIKGMDKDTFGYGDSVTVHQFQAVLLRALGYEEESGLWNTVPDIAEKLGIMTDLTNNPKDNLSRGQMAVMTLNTLKQTKKGSTLTLAEVLSIDLKSEAPLARSLKR